MSTNFSLSGFGSLLAPTAPTGGATAGEVKRSVVDLSQIGNDPRLVAPNLFGCTCSTNPSGLSPEELKAAQAANGVK